MRYDSGRQIHFTPFNDKVADITEADINLHTITLATLGFPLNTRILILGSVRVAGTGVFRVYPNEGGTALQIGGGAVERGKPIGIINERLQYNLTVINDDWDLYCWGYWIESQ